MQIYIVYESSWQNSFLHGTDEAVIDKTNLRTFKATSKSKIDDFREISHTTILGILCRLIGDQRKLYMARQSDDYYFRDMESLITFTHYEKFSHFETAFVINKSENRPPQNNYMGVLSSDTPLFFNEYSKNLWCVLDFDIDELIDFILHPKAMLEPLGKASPNRHIRSRIEEISTQEPLMLLETKISNIKELIKKESDKHSKKIESGKKITEKEQQKLEQLKEKLFKTQISESEIKFSNKLEKVISRLKQKFHNSDKEHLVKGHIYPMALYSAGLYIMLDELVKLGLDTSVFLNKTGNIQGFNPFGFNGVRDFLNPLTGKRKRCGGTPVTICKSSGVLRIELNISNEQAGKLEELIEAAGVSTFYLGKKGLAYACVNRLRR